MNITVFDWAVLAVLLLSMLLGAWRGLVHEVLALAGWVAAFVLAQLFAAAAGQWLPMQGAGPGVRYAAGFAAVFICTIIAASVLTLLIKRMIESVGLRPIDRTLGAAFGVLRGLLILLAVATVVLMTPLKRGDWWQQSVSAEPLSSVLKSIKPVLPAEFGQYIQAAAQFAPVKGFVICVES